MQVGPWHHLCYDLSEVLFSSLPEVGSDYVGLVTTLSFEACDTKRCVEITTLDDDVKEDTEDFGVSLQNLSHGRIALTRPEGIITLTDNDGR